MSAWQPGTVLGAYVVEAQIGHGAWSVVYKARRSGLETPVAVKVLLSNLASQPGFVERFKREARAVSKLHHRNIVTLYEFDERDGAVYIVMEYVPGRSLGQMLRAPIALGRSVDYMCQLADALHYAHGLGVIHRDIKPGNMMIEERTERMVLMDFGFSQIAEETLQLTRPGTNLGTPHFMSPEQVLGKPVDQRTDIFAMGVVLYQLVTGKLPYASENAVTVMKKVLQEPMPRPSVEVPTLPPALEDVILKATAKRREDRYASAIAMKEALQAAWSPFDVVTRASSATRDASDSLDRAWEIAARRPMAARSVPPAVANGVWPAPRDAAVARPTPSARSFNRAESGIATPSPAASAGPPETPAPTVHARVGVTPLGGRPSSLLSRSKARYAMPIHPLPAMQSLSSVGESPLTLESTARSPYPESLASTDPEPFDDGEAGFGWSPNMVAMVVVAAIVIFFLIVVLAHH